MKRSKLFKLLLTSVVLGVLILPVLAGCTTPDQPDVTPSDDDATVDTPSDDDDATVDVPSNDDDVTNIPIDDGKLSVEIVLGAYKKTIRVESGTIVTEQDIPRWARMLQHGLYLDRECTQVYNSEPITESTTLYVKTDCEIDASAELIDAAVKSYYEQGDARFITIDDVVIEGYFGKYSDGLAVFISAAEMYAQVITEINVGGVHFVYGDSQQIEYYRDGVFYMLDKAYEQGLLTDADIHSIAKRYDMDYYNKAQENERIIQQYVEWGNKNDFTRADIRYFGRVANLDSGIVVYVEHKGSEYLENTQQIGDVTLTFRRTLASLMLYCDGAIVPLESAYQSGLLSAEQLQDIQQQMKSIDWYIKPRTVIDGTEVVW